MDGYTPNDVDKYVNNRRGLMNSGTNGRHVTGADSYGTSSQRAGTQHPSQPNDHTGWKYQQRIVITQSTTQFNRNMDILQQDGSHQRSQHQNVYQESQTAQYMSQSFHQQAQYNPSSQQMDQQAVHQPPHQIAVYQPQQQQGLYQHSQQEAVNHRRQQSGYLPPQQQTHYQPPHQQTLYQPSQQQAVYQTPPLKPVYQRRQQKALYQSPQQDALYQQPQQHAVYQSPQQHAEYQSTQQQSGYQYTQHQAGYQSTQQQAGYQSTQQQSRYQYTQQQAGYQSTQQQSGYQYTQQQAGYQSTQQHAGYQSPQQQAGYLHSQQQSLYCLSPKQQSFNQSPQQRAFFQRRQQRTACRSAEKKSGSQTYQQYQSPNGNTGTPKIQYPISQQHDERDNNNNQPSNSLVELKLMLTPCKLQEQHLNNQQDNQQAQEQSQILPQRRNVLSASPLQIQMIHDEQAGTKLNPIIAPSRDVYDHLMDSNIPQLQQGSSSSACTMSQQILESQQYDSPDPSIRTTYSSDQTNFGPMRRLHSRHRDASQSRASGSQDVMRQQGSSGQFNSAQRWTPYSSWPAVSHQQPSSAQSSCRYEVLPNDQHPTDSQLQTLNNLNMPQSFACQKTARLDCAASAPSSSHANDVNMDCTGGTTTQSVSDAPNALDAGSTKKSRKTISAHAKIILNNWYENHKDHPYPSAEEMRQLTDGTGINRAVITKYYANKRLREGNTKTVTEIAKHRSQGPGDDGE